MVYSSLQMVAVELPSELGRMKGNSGVVGLYCTAEAVMSLIFPALPLFATSLSLFESMSLVRKESHLSCSCCVPHLRLHAGNLFEWMKDKRNEKT